MPVLCSVYNPDIHKMLLYISENTGINTIKSESKILITQKSNPLGEISLVGVK